jgi:hypothetical protein
MGTGGSALIASWNPEKKRRVMKRIKVLIASALMTVPLLSGCTGGTTFGSHDKPVILAFVFETFLAGPSVLPGQTPIPGDPLPEQNILWIADGQDKNGNQGHWWNDSITDSNGERVGGWDEYPARGIVKTPFSHGQTILPGEAAHMTMFAIYAGYVGEILTCNVFVDGQLIPNKAQIAVVQAGDDGSEHAPLVEHGHPFSAVTGTARVTCKFDLVN